jgi:hypothetical protein
MWKQNWNLIIQYCMPSIIILLVLLATFCFLETRHIADHTTQVQRVLARTLGVRQLHRPLPLSTMLRTATQWTKDRLELAFFTLSNLVYLSVCTITLKGLICVEVEGAYRLLAEKSQLCWSHEHLPVGTFSVLMVPLLLLYPVFIYTYMQDRLEAWKNVSPIVPKRKASARVSARASARVRVLLSRFVSAIPSRVVSARAKDDTGLKARAINKGGRTKGRSKAQKSHRILSSVPILPLRLRLRTFALVAILADPGKLAVFFLRVHRCETSFHNVDTEHM